MKIDVFKCSTTKACIFLAPIFLIAFIWCVSSGWLEGNELAAIRNKKTAIKENNIKVSSNVVVCFFSLSNSFHAKVIGLKY